MTMLWVKTKMDANFYWCGFLYRLNSFVDIVPEMSSAIATEDECETELFCGMPLYTTRMLTQS